MGSDICLQFNDLYNHNKSFQVTNDYAKFVANQMQISNLVSIFLCFCLFLHDVWDLILSIIFIICFKMCKGLTVPEIH